MVKASWRRWFVALTVMVATIFSNGSARTFATSQRAAFILRRIPIPGAQDLAVDAPLNRIFVASTSQGVVMLDARTGAIVKTVSAGIGISSIAVDDKLGRVVAANFQTGDVSTIDARTGAIINTVNVNAPAFQVAVNKILSQAYITTQNGVSVINTRDGKSEGSVQAVSCTGAAIARKAYRIYVNDRSGKITIFNAVFGTPVAAVNADPVRRALIPDDVHNIMYVASADYLAQVAASTGHIGPIVKITSLTPYVTPRRGIVDNASGRLFLGADVNIGGHVSSIMAVVSLNSGHVIRVIAIPGLPPIETHQFINVDEKRGHVYVIDSGTGPLAQDSVSILDARSGSMLATRGLGLSTPDNAHAIAVDGDTGRAFIAAEEGVLMVDTSVTV